MGDFDVSLSQPSGRVRATARVDASTAPALNAKLETFVVERMSAEDQVLVRERHPVMAAKPELSKILDILEADDEFDWS